MINRRLLFKKRRTGVIEGIKRYDLSGRVKNFFRSISRLLYASRTNANKTEIYEIKPYLNTETNT